MTPCRLVQLRPPPAPASSTDCMIEAAAGDQSISSRRCGDKQGRGGRIRLRRRTPGERTGGCGCRRNWCPCSRRTAHCLEFIHNGYRCPHPSVLQSFRHENYKTMTYNHVILSRIQAEKNSFASIQRYSIFLTIKSAFRHKIRNEVLDSRISCITQT